MVTISLLLLCEDVEPGPTPSAPVTIRNLIGGTASDVMPVTVNVAAMFRVFDPELSSPAVVDLGLTITSPTGRLAVVPGALSVRLRPDNPSIAWFSPRPYVFNDPGTYIFGVRLAGASSPLARETFKILVIPGRGGGAFLN